MRTIQHAEMSKCLRAFET